MYRQEKYVKEVFLKYGAKFDLFIADDNNIELSPCKSFSQTYSDSRCNHVTITDNSL
jgi:hypothetical protein